MFRFPAGSPPKRDDPAAGCRSCRICPDSSPAPVHAPWGDRLRCGLGQNISLQGAAREGARQGVTQGDVIASTTQASGLLDETKLQVKFAVDSSGGAPGVMVVCTRYPQSSLSGFYSWVLDGFFESKAVMRLEGTAPVTSGAQNWNGGSCTP